MRNISSFDFIPTSAKSPAAVLCKDFIIDPYQICLARYYQADACLLIFQYWMTNNIASLHRRPQSGMGVLTSQ
ncbi:MAG: hypothetical protein ACLRP3_08915 [Escherichia sp.]